MLEYNRATWRSEYGVALPPPELTRPEGIINSYLYDFQQAYLPHRRGDDDFIRYTEGSIITNIDWKEQNLFQWWNTCDFVSLRQFAFDTLSIPAMSAELERVFSQSKRTWTDDRNALKPESFEALQCLKQWSLQGLYNFSASS
jgi:hypothetical protein